MPLESPWIMSEGGPLICLETALLHSWGGIFNLSVSAANATNDYDRACLTRRFLDTVELQSGSALIIGDEALDTCFWTSDEGCLYIVRIFFCESDFDLTEKLISLPHAIFDNPLDTLRMEFRSADITMFDSAEEGSDDEIKSVSAILEPGCYDILTQNFEPDDGTSLYLNKFQKL